jgi:hypothetical protein
MAYGFAHNRTFVSLFVCLFVSWAIIVQWAVSYTILKTAPGSSGHWDFTTHFVVGGVNHTCP